MEIILVLVVVAVLGYWAWNANNAKKDQLADKHPLDIINDNAVEKSAPYKVPEPVAPTPIPLVVEVAEPAPVVETKVVEPAPVKKAPVKKAPVKKASVPAKKTAVKKAVPVKKTTAKKPAV
jgi:hypothetical protein